MSQVPFVIVCSSCGKTYQATPADIGVDIECPACGAHIKAVPVAVDEMAEGITDLVREYQLAGDGLKAARCRAKHVADAITSAGSMMPDWQKIVVTGFGMAVPEGTAGQYSIDGQCWPDGRGLSDAFSDYHRCKRNLGDLFKQLTEDEQDNVCKPELYDRD
jgi:hypothetical protein